MFFFRFHEMNSRVFFPFEINQESNTLICEIDTDLQFYTESNYMPSTSCEYYLEDFFDELELKTVIGQNSTQHVHEKLTI